MTNKIVILDNSVELYEHYISDEQWSGDFYWVYMAQANLTDEQVQQVIDYNENL